MIDQVWKSVETYLMIFTIKYEIPPSIFLGIEASESGPYCSLDSYRVEQITLLMAPMFKKAGTRKWIRQVSLTRMCPLDNACLPQVRDADHLPGSRNL